MRRRQAFTIVELLVSLALIIFIMVVMTEAFSAGMGTFRQLKAVGDMQERLRAATSILRHDLVADHFEGHRKLSDGNFWGTPIREGFFRIVQGSSGSAADGIDNSLNGLPTPLPPVTATDHRLHFTVKLRGNNKKDYFTAAILPEIPGTTKSPLVLLPSGGTIFGGNFGNEDGRPARFQRTENLYHSAWAEVGYFLARSPNDPSTVGWAEEDPNKPGGGISTPPQPLYTLYRTQMVLIPDNTHFQMVNDPPAPPNVPPIVTHEEFSCKLTDPAVVNGSIRFNSPMDLTVLTNRVFQPDLPLALYNPAFPFATNIANPAAIRAATPLLSDVISFSVRILRRPYGSGSTPSDPYFTDIDPVGGVRNFDTTFTTAPDHVLRAVQITIRVYDARTEQTRQVTIIQDL